MCFSWHALSVRGLTSACFAALALLCVLVAGGVGWVAAVLQDTGAQLSRDAGSLGLATQIELRLLNFQRLAALAVDPAAQIERRTAEIELRRTLGAAISATPSPADRVLLERTVRDIESYLERRAELERTGGNLLDIQRRVRPLLNDALASVRLLRETSETEVQAAQTRAQSIGSFFIDAALGIVLLAAALLLLMTLIVSRALIRPILALRATIERFHLGDLDAKADERAPRELREIARAFNEMSAELQRQRSNQLAFVAGVAHDLRNPLSALQYSLDAMKRQRDVRDCETERLVVVLGRQLDHLSRMVNDLLETASVEAGELSLTCETFDVREAVRSVVELYRPIAAERAVVIELGNDPALAHADRTRMEQVVGNLMNNAIKYSAVGDRISVELARHDGVVELVVADDGVGILHEDLEKIFHPFRRGGLGAGRVGAGLGLSVVRKIVVAHGGSIEVDSAPGKGSVFRVRIPAARTLE